MGVSGYDGDDVRVKGEDGSEDGLLIDGLTDAAGTKRLAVSPCEKTSTNHFNGTVNTFGVFLPSTSANEITTVLVKNPASNAFAEILHVSFDGGTTYFDLRRKEHIIWTVVDSLTQIKIKGSTATVDYQVIMNRESS